MILCKFCWKSFFLGWGGGWQPCAPLLLVSVYFLHLAIDSLSSSRPAMDCVTSLGIIWPNVRKWQSNALVALARLFHELVITPLICWDHIELAAMFVFAIYIALFLVSGAGLVGKWSWACACCEHVVNCGLSEACFCISICTSDNAHTMRRGVACRPFDVFFFSKQSLLGGGLLARQRLAFSILYLEMLCVLLFGFVTFCANVC